MDEENKVYKEAFKLLCRDLAHVTDICAEHARLYGNHGRVQAMEAYRHCANMLRRIEYGQPPMDDETYEADVDRTRKILGEVVWEN